MKRGTPLVVVGIVLMIGGLATGLITTAVQQFHVYTAIASDAPPEVLAEYIYAALYGTAIGCAVCILGIGVLIAGLVMRARGRRAKPNGPNLAA